MFDNTDVYVYTGEIERKGHLLLTNAIDTRKKQVGLKDNVLFCIATYGGNPDAGYRIGRALQHNYKHITMLILGPCKSAGTLIAVAAHKLIIGDMGELGPLDIQLKKNDEIGELSSGLVIQTALEELKDCALSAFRSYLVNIKLRNQISTKMSADIAAKLTEALVSPMASQIDPIKLGEHQRAMTIALSYGNRLNGHSKNLKENSLRKLIASYPAHGFVIDRKEAKELFNQVERPNDKTDVLYRVLGGRIQSGEISINGNAEVFDFLPLNNKNEPERDANDGGNEERAGGAKQNTGKAEPGNPKPGKRSSRKHAQPQSPVSSIPTEHDS
ncbi:SDH family Clp fold serine proteinase [Enterobacter cloacae]|uniref:SDH family Clp fold serine proteinase n=1 Tax=Enterobacter cloacae TaxID=550 RepID=UPI000BB1D5D5|nr:SppA protein [Enterobacter cloacae]